MRMNGATITVYLAAGAIKLKGTILNRYGVQLAKGARTEWGVEPDDTLVFADERQGGV